MDVRSVRGGGTLVGMNEFPKRWCALLVLSSCVASGCGAVPFLNRDPAASRQRTARFDRFVDELHVTLLDSAPLLDRIRLSGSDGGSVRWSESRRVTTRRSVALRALERLEDDFAPSRLDAPRAATARTIRLDLLRELGLDDEAPLNAASNPKSDAVLRGPWSGLLTETASVLAREHNGTNAEDVESWRSVLEDLFPTSRVARDGRTSSSKGVDPSEFERSFGPRASVLVGALYNDFMRLRASAGTGGISDPYAGPYAETARAIRGPEGARLARESRRDLLKRIEIVIELAFDALKQSRRQIAEAAGARTVAPLSARARQRWLLSLRDAAGPDAEPSALDDLARREIDRLTLEIGAALELDATADTDSIRAEFRRLRNLDRIVPGSGVPRTPVVLWNLVTTELGGIVAGELPPIPLDVETARTFERPHGRWSPYVRGNLAPVGDPRERPFLFLASRERDPTVPRWLHEAEALRYGIPGHALLDAFRRAAVDQPLYLRAREREAFESAWGLYALSELATLGALEFDDDGFGWRTQELIVFTQMVLDIGLHERGWSTNQALETALEFTPLQESAATELVMRAVAQPGRAALAGIGLLRLRSLRAGVEEALGSAFSAPVFHRALIGSGPLPLPELDMRIEVWLEESRSNASRRSSSPRR